VYQIHLGWATIIEGVPENFAGIHALGGAAIHDSQ